MADENASGKIRKGAALIMLICLAVLAVIGGDYVLHLPAFDIRTIEVTGETAFTDVEALETQLRENLNGNYFSADLDRIRSIAEKSPWVASAKIERIWPDQIRVTVTRRRAAAFWGKGRLISDRGEVFAPRSLDLPETADLPHFSGPDAMAPEVVEMYGKLEAFPRRLGASILALDVTERGSWSAVIEGGSVPRTKIELGRKTEDSTVEERLALVVAHYGEASRMLGGAPSAIDARYVNAFAASLPKPVSQTPADAGAAPAAGASVRRGPAV